MNETLVVLSCALALAWLPLAVRFNRGWKTRRNPVSLAISAAMCLFVYTNILFVLALLEQTTWRFFVIATHAFDAIVVANFYVAFRWANKRFPDSRTNSYSVPPTNRS